MKHITMNKLTIGMCKWPHGDPKDSDFHFCGDPGAMDRSYCPAHTVMAHAEARSQRRAK